MDLSRRVAVVTGASRGVGFHIACRLATAGAHVGLVARNSGALRQVLLELHGHGAVAEALPADCSRPDEVERLKRAVEQALGPPAILVNAAGVFGPLQLIRNSNVDEWIQTLQVNTIAPYLTCRAFVGAMVDAGWGRIVNVSSAAALAPPGPLNSAYATSKVALNQLTRQLAAELVGTGVTAEGKPWRDAHDYTVDPGTISR